MRELELLAPAANAEIAIQAILHGADAVYMGASSHGARRKAANSTEDIKRVVDFAHVYRAKVYVTVNTLVRQDELESVQSLVWDLYRIGVDAIIVQDMGLLRLDLPPIALHASTQCDTRTVEKARFLEEVGFSQIVLARELTLCEIGEICQSLTVPVECFVQGALCVSYSGRCQASQACFNRSANRGDCAQVCRLPFTLTDADGHVLARDRHLLSLRDFNASAKIPAMAEAGVRSFKIEGRLKDAAYVKNVTASYSRILDSFIATHPDEYRRSSYGRCDISFEPALAKSFNRGFTTYFLESRRPSSISQPLTPKSMGEVITDVRQLNNGDGISYFDEKGIYQGVMVNGVRDGRIIGSKPFSLPKGAEIHRTFDREFSGRLGKDTAVRKLRVDITIDEQGVTARDERGVSARVSLDGNRDVARRPMQPRGIFEKLGNTPYYLGVFENCLKPETFIPASQLTEVRRRLIDALDNASRATYSFDRRREENVSFPYPDRTLISSDNVANDMARKFYRDHGVEHMAKALEAGGKVAAGDTVMVTRHCILRELGACRRVKGAKRLREPLILTSANLRFGLDFDCDRCEMHVLLKSKT